MPPLCAASVRACVPGRSWGDQVQLWQAPLLCHPPAPRPRPPRAGVKDLYVHTMAVNEVALRFYERNGFVVEKEETSNQAHYRGRCLDGIEGRGRTVLLRDTQL